MGLNVTRTVLVLGIGLLLWPATPGSAGQQEPDDTRTEALLAERRARLAEVEPADDSTIVRMLTTIENDGFDQIVTVQAGHFRFGFGQISPASGGTPAIQYERPRLGATPLTLRTAAAYSLRGYQAYDLQFGVFDRPAPYTFAGDGFLGAPFDFDNRSVAPLDELLYLDAHYQRFPKEEFFGVGPASSNADRSRYAIERGGVDLVAGYQPVRWLAVSGRVGLVRVETGPGDGDRFPDQLRCLRGVGRRPQCSGARVRCRGLTLRRPGRRALLVQPGVGRCSWVPPSGLSPADDRSSGLRLARRHRPGCPGAVLSYGDDRGQRDPAWVP